MPYRTRNSSRFLSIAAFFIFVATLFFWLSALSTPIAKKIYYIETREDRTRFGNFGWCAVGNTLCHRAVGYAFRPWIPAGSHATGALIIVALTAAFGTIALFALLHSIMDLRSGAGSFFLTLLTTLLATISFLLVTIIFGTAHHRFSHDNLDPHFGSAFALVIVGWILYLLSLPLLILGWFRQRKHIHDGPVVSETRTTTETATGKKRFF